VIREVVAVPDAANDPPENYSSHNHEMIARAPHNTNAFREDREKVFQLLVDICRNDLSYTVLERAVSTRNGRRAYELLYDHYLGPSAVDHLVASAESKLQSLTYSGKEGRRWNLDKFVMAHKESHALMDTMQRRGIYAGMDERSKVRQFVNGISDPRLDAVKVQILSSNLRNDFDGSVRLCKDSIAMQTSQHSKKLHVSGVTTDAEGAPEKVEDRYYSEAQYNAFMPAQRKQLWDIRSKRGGGKGKGKGKGKDGGGSGPRKGPQSLKKVNQRFKKLNRQISALKAKLKPADSSSESDDSDTEPKKSNRNNPALTRQKSKK
jgi:hypothetical protein